ncbi:hypothetical protein ACFX19_040848 [Malus domestica]
MESGKALSARFVVVAFFAIALLGETSPSCPPSSCGNIQNISYPFRLQDDPKNCGESMYNLFCEDNVTVLRINSGRYYVKSINYNNNTIRVVDPGFDHNNCSSVPLYSLSSDSIIFGSPYSVYSYDIHYRTVWISRAITFLNCASPVNSSLYVETAPCINISRSGSTTLSQLKTYSYVAGGRPWLPELKITETQLLTVTYTMLWCMALSFRYRALAIISIGKLFVFFSDAKHREFGALAVGKLMFGPHVLFGFGSGKGEGICQCIAL